MLISDLLQDVPPSVLKTKVLNLLPETVEQLAHQIANDRYNSDNPKNYIRNIIGFGPMSVDVTWPLLKPYLERTIPMDIEQELRELTDAWMAKGVTRDAVISTLDSRSAWLSGQEAEEAADEDDESPPAA